MKIAMVLSTFPPISGGAGSSCEIISMELIKRGHEVHIITQKFNNEEKDFEEKTGLKIFRVKTPFSSGKTGLINFYKTAKKISDKIKELDKNENYDIIHSHEVTIGNSAVFMYTYGKENKRRKTVLKYGGDLVYEVLGTIKPKGWLPEKGYLASWKFSHILSRIFFILEKKMINHYALVYSNSEYGKWLLENEMKVNKKIKIVRNPIDTQKFKPMRKFLFKDYNKIVAITISRLVPWKGIETAIDAVKKLNGKVYLIVIGDGVYKERLKSMADKNIAFVNSIPHEKINDYINSCDIYIHPSYFDPNPNSLLEAMSCGKPCISANITTIKEFVKDNWNGLLFSAGNSDELKNKIGFLINNKKSGRLGNNAVKSILKNNSIGVVVDKIEKLYRCIK
ncbi:MAG: glycosyltransferase family 4 protein [Candidatus Nanoarchaeia archaeon]|nr:glycosyltransferase family 4 protein [Candidatus Nanoarchaeia archaeon]